MNRNTLALALALSLAACKKKEDKPGATGGDTASATQGSTAAGGDTAAPPPAPAASTFKKLGGLALEAEVPADAEITDNTAGAGFPSVTIYATPTTFVMGGGDMSSLKATIEETKEELGKDPNKLKAITKEEKTADGWIIELTRESMVEPGKELVGVAIRRTIDGVAWDCGTNAQSADEAAKAAKICQSLRAAK